MKLLSGSFVVDRLSLCKYIKLVKTHIESLAKGQAKKYRKPKSDLLKSLRLVIRCRFYYPANRGHPILHAIQGGASTDIDCQRYCRCCCRDDSFGVILAHIDDLSGWGIKTCPKQHPSSRTVLSKC